MEEQSLGQIGYEAYCNERNWKSYDGQPLPKWEDVSPPIKEAWESSGIAVASYLQVKTTEFVSLQYDTKTTKEIEDFLNIKGIDNYAGIPDFRLAKYLIDFVDLAKKILKENE